MKKLLNEAIDFSYNITNNCINLYGALHAVYENTPVRGPYRVFIIAKNDGQTHAFRPLLSFGCNHISLERHRDNETGEYSAHGIIEYDQGFNHANQCKLQEIINLFDGELGNVISRASAFSSLLVQGEEVVDGRDAHHQQTINNGIKLYKDENAHTYYICLCKDLFNDAYQQISLLRQRVFSSTLAWSNEDNVKTCIQEIAAYSNGCQEARPACAAQNFDASMFRRTGDQNHDAEVLKAWNNLLMLASLYVHGQKFSDLATYMSSIGIHFANNNAFEAIDNVTPGQFAAQQPQQNGQQPQQNNQQQVVNYEIQQGAHTDFYTRRTHFSPQRIYVLGRGTFDQFQQWWAQQPADFKQTMCGGNTHVAYCKFLGTVNDNDKTCKNTKLIAFDPQHMNLMIYGIMQPPHRTRPDFKVIQMLRIEWKDVFAFFTNADGAWHNHLYGLRNWCINSGPHGMVIAWDPDGYLNWLYSNLPAGNRPTLHDVGPGVPQTIGLHVTDDLTVGIQRRQMAPLTAEQQAAVDAANAQIQAAEQQATQEVENRRSRMASTSQELHQAMPEIFTDPMYKNIIQYWPGNVVGQNNQQRELNGNITFSGNRTQERVIIRFPGADTTTQIDGADEVSNTAQQYGIAEFIQPIVDLVRQRLPNAAISLRFDGRLQ